VIALADVEVGLALPGQTFEISRADLVRYAGASGDLNQIHWSDRFANEVGLPGVIAHGMFTMATAVRVVSDWLGDPGLVLEYGVRFTKPVPVPDDGTASLRVEGVVASLDPQARTARVDLTASIPGPDGATVTVLGRARALVRLA
jgi:acyl dehydratase